MNGCFPSQSLHGKMLFFDCREGAHMIFYLISWTFLNDPRVYWERRQRMSLMKWTKREREWSSLQQQSKVLSLRKTLLGLHELYVLKRFFDQLNTSQRNKQIRQHYLPSNDHLNMFKNVFVLIIKSSFLFLIPKKGHCSYDRFSNGNKPSSVHQVTSLQCQYLWMPNNHAT